MVFVSVPVLYFGLLQKDYKSQDVKGANYQNNNPEKKGIGLIVNSRSGTWDLYKYVCKDENDCNSSLTSGKKLGISSGGEVQEYKVTLTPSSEWDTNNFLKVFVKPGWGSPERKFNINVLNSGESELKVVDMKDSGSTYEVLLIPLSRFKNEFLDIGSINDF